MICFELSKKLNFATGSGSLALKVDESLQGKRVVLTGESGSGKTTLLRMLAGLTKPDSGRICFNGQSWFDSETGVNHPPQKRTVGMVFQNYALFPNMTIREQFLYANPDEQTVNKLMEAVGLTELANARPHQLSGGQKQRVALIRAIAPNPPLLLLDEPLSAVDAVMRKKLQSELLTLQERYGMTMFIVSHDYHEIMRLAHRVLVLKDGKSDTRL